LEASEESGERATPPLLCSAPLDGRKERKVVVGFGYGRYKVT
jgi:hypothetical protein